jgi:hypothetical protein
MNDSNDNIAVSQHGSVTRVQLGAPAPEFSPAQQRPSIRVGNEVTRLNFGGTSESAESTGRTTYAHTTAGVSGASVLATLDRQGKSRSVELIPGVPASRTDIAVAIKEGLLVRDAAGNLQDAPDAQQVQAMQQAPQEEQAQGDAGAGVFDPEHDSIWNEAIQPLPQPAYDAAVASGIAAVLGQGDTQQTAKALAANAGLEPEQAIEFVEAGIGMYTQVVERALAPLGIDGERRDQAYEYFRSQPAKLQDALQRLLHGRDVSGFTELAKNFRVSNPDQRQLSALKGAGFEVRVDRESGDLLARLGQGGWQRAADLLTVRTAPAAPVAQPARPPKATQSERKVIDPISGDLVTEAQLKAWGY